MSVEALGGGQAQVNIRILVSLLCDALAWRRTILMEEMGRSNEERHRDPRGWADVILMRPSSAWGHYACQDLVRTPVKMVLGYKRRPDETRQVNLAWM